MPTDVSRGGFLWRVFSRVSILLCLAMVLVCLITWGITLRAFHTYTDAQLRSSAQLVASVFRECWPLGSERALLNKCRELRNQTGLRVTVINRDGTVLGESDGQPVHMENHARRPEVAAALAGQVGQDRRSSVSVGHPFQYVAVPLRIDGQVAAVVRVAAPVERFQRLDASLLQWVVTGLAVSLPVALLLAWMVSRALAEPVRRVGEWARRLARGELVRREELEAEGEVGQVIKTLDQMRVSLAERIREVQQQRQDLSVTLGNLEEGVVAVNAQGLVIMANPAAYRLLSRERPMVGWPLTVGLGEGSLSALWKEAVASPGRDLQREVTLETADGRRTLSVSVCPVHESDTPIAWLVCLRDISELARSAAMKTDFVANASHELRTPVAAIRAAAETLEADGLDEATRRRFLSVIRRSVGRLQGLTEKLMQLNRMESTATQLRPGTFKLAPMLRGLQASFADALEKKRARLEIESGVHEIQTDPHWLEIILSNLLDNAVKFVNEGGKVAVRCRQSDDRWHFEVQDDGCGIPEKDLGRVFERFYQADKSRSLGAGGTGLGLAIVKHAVHSLAGDIELRSAVGEGTTVTFWLPRPSAEPVRG